MRHIVMVMIENVGEHQRRALQPGNAAHCRQVGLQDEIAIAFVPARGGIAGHRLHVDVVGQQVIARMRFLVGTVDEIAGLEAFADEPPLHVHHGDDDRIDSATLGRFLQIV